MSRTNDVTAARAAADEWASAHALSPSGGYSGSWYTDAYLGGWWPNGWVKWWADYNGDPGSLIGGTVVAHQYGSNPIDQDAMLETEILTLTTPPAPERQTPADWPWPTWEEAADNFKGIADALGPQVAALQAQLDTLKASLSAQALAVLVAQLAQTAKDRDAAVAARNVALAKIAKAKLALA